MGKFFISKKDYKKLQVACSQKDLRIAALEGLWADQKRDSVSCEVRILRRGIRSLQRQLDGIEVRQDGV